MALVLVVDDDRDMSNLVRDGLTSDGHVVRQAFDGSHAIDALEREVPDLVVLDLVLPDLDGLTVCRTMRERHTMPIIMLTARAEEIDRVIGLELGADDYLTKPFSLRELRVRVRSLLRRVELEARRHAPGEEVTTIGPLELDPAAHQVRLDGEPVALTPTEFRLLELLIANPLRAFNRDFLADRLWDGTVDSVDRAIDTHVSRLRRKLGRVGEQIVTVRGVGYRFEHRDR